MLPADARGVPFACEDCSRIDMGSQHAGAIPPNAMRVYLLGHGDPQPIAFHVEPIHDPDGLSDQNGFDPQRVLVVPESWSPGERYLFVAWPCENPAVAVRVDRDRAADAAADSSAHATLQADGVEEGRISSMTRGGSCSSQFEAASVHVRMRLPNRLYYFDKGFLYYTRVDADRLWHPSPSLCGAMAFGRSWAGVAEEKFYVRCPEAAPPNGLRWGASPDEPGLAPGKHTVEMIAWLPGTTVEFRAKVEIDVRCGGSPSSAH